MLKIRIEGYEYAGGSRGRSWEVVVGGYDPDGNWYNYFAEIHGAAPFNKVRLANDGTKDVILLGDTSTVWVEPKIVVAEVMAGYSNYTGWETGWAINWITDEAGIVNIFTPVIDFFRSTSGNIGIGSTAPSYKLDVQGGQVNASGGLCIAGDCKTSWSQASGPWTISGSNIYSNNSGNVGIGTMSPTTLLHVYKPSGESLITIEAGSNNALVNYRNSGTDRWRAGSVYADQSFRFFRWTGSAWNTDMTINSSGNVGIGTASPESKLHVSGGNVLVDNARTLQTKNSAGAVETWMWPRYSDNIMYTNYGSAGWNIRNNASTPVMFMTNTGVVGIGTTSPDSNVKLEVVGGPIKATGGLIMETRTNNPTSPAVGQIWMCTDSGYDCQ